jgi:hypothetical protein
VDVQLTAVPFGQGGECGLIACDRRADGLIGACHQVTF